MTRTWAALIVASLWGAAACDSPSRPTEDSPPIAAQFKVSNPAPASVPPGTPSAVSGGAADAAADQVVYVSLLPGAIPSGTVASVRVRSSGATVQTPLIGGGFDPVPIAAAAGDSLDVAVQLSTSSNPLSFILTVPIKVRPIVVRTNPTPHKRDVPLNASLLVIFNKPIDPTSLTGSAVELHTGGVVVPRTLTFGDPTHLAVTVTGAPLARLTDYELVITPAIRGWDGDGLETAVTVPFTTADTLPAVPNVATQLAFSVPPVSTVAVVAGLAVLPPIKVTALDAMGNRVTGFSRPINLTLGTNASGASLSGTTTALAQQGEVSFSDLTINKAGSGYTISANSDEPGRVRGVLSGGFDVSPGPAAVGLSGRIAFVGQPPGEGQSAHVYLLDLDAGTVTQLTNDPRGDFDPAWSPDCTRIAFARSTGAFGPATTGEIYVMNADGSGATLSSAHGVGPSWSPDGARIAFADPGGIYVMSADGSAESRLLGATPGSDVDFGGVAWSPDGLTIAFHVAPYYHDPGGDDFYWPPEVYLMNADGTAMRRLTSGSGPEARPSWSPDGLRLVFWSEEFGITLSDGNGSGISSLLGAASAPFNSFRVWGSTADWSPGADWLVFGSGPQLSIARSSLPGVSWPITSLLRWAYSPSWCRARP